MDLQLHWMPPVRLRDGADEYLTYTSDQLDQIPENPGIYIFGRRHGTKFSALYIGKAKNLCGRITQQLNATRLMNVLAYAQSGERQLLVGVLRPKGGQRVERALTILERGLIKLALAEGHELVNVHGTRIRSHEVTMAGNRDARSWLPARRVWLDDPSNRTP